MDLQKEFSKMNEIKEKLEFIVERLNKYIFSLKMVSDLENHDVSGQTHMKAFIEACHKRILSYLDGLDEDIRKNLNSPMITQDQLDFLKKTYLGKDEKN